MDNIMEKVGCRPVYQKLGNSVLPRCSRKEQMHEIGDLLFASAKTYLPPCQRVTDIRYDFAEQDIDNRFMDMLSVSNGVEATVNDPNSTGFLGIWTVIQEDSYREIKQVRAYGIQSLIGNAGGYLGLFLGTTLWSMF